MKRSFFVLMAMSLIVLTAVVGCAVDEDAKPEYLFAMPALSGTANADSLTLNNVSHVIYFSDRPDRIAGHMTLEDFVKNWNEGSDSFTDDPPNATLSVLDESGTTETVVELLNLKIDGAAVTFTVKVLEGKLLESFGPATLFIDAFPTAVNSQITD